MPVYNCEEYVQASIESILSQSFTNFELLVCDDASTDQTLKLVEHYAKIDNRVKILQNEKNLNVAATLNKLIDASNGYYLARHDGDDIAYSTRLDRQLSYMEDQNIDLCFTRAHVVDESGEVICNYYTPDLDSCLKWLERKVYFVHPTMMSRKEVFQIYGNYRTDYGNREDKELWLRLRGNIRFGLLEDFLHGLRMNLSSVTHTIHGKLESEYKYEAAKSCLRNFDLKHYGSYKKRLSGLSGLKLSLAKFLRYYKIREFSRLHLPLVANLIWRF